ncbi:MAG: TRAP transporter large permease subunit [Desulfobacula sp.]|jgi:tripartite ATP-independent transporter DctM subunit|uniref:TRAP transporter large permease n=1 Tax=Desulfobacula sp. TaxID=2593537 RepID=UPI001DDD21C3|nr:TRAP transporter large permease subunit [Desulfobacula sp.]MBT4027606.1 TRAP transporter large permease subunit [Desulfobacula sp.]MBT5973883.1 TRAP transporter large permease subunit [Desulfobacula sp.]MBT6751928.1 TRAP transporter large permease subunit [Desulfobacula sp.]
METGDYFVIAMFLTFVGFLFTGFPVAWVLGGVAVLYTLIATISDTWFGTMIGLDYITLGMAVNRVFKYMDNWVLVALPMFIFMGLMLDKSGIAEKMMESMQELFGKVHGGLAVTVTLIGIVLAASTGIIGASVVLLGLLSLPAMIKQGYSKTLALGTIASAGTLGILIPPSIMLVIMADQLGLSVGDLFMGAVIPGMLLGVLYILYILIFSYLKPDSAPISEDRRPIEWRMIFDVFKTILPPVILIIAVLGSIFAGITTPTEASGVGALGATILAAYNKRLNFVVIVDVMKSCFNTTAYIFAIFLGATTFALVLRCLGGDEFIERILTGIPFGPYGILIVILGCVFLLGFFLDWIEITLIILPLIAPVISSLGFSVNGFDVVTNPELLWFVVLVAVTLQTSFLTPPVGFALFYLKGVCPPEIKLIDIYRGVVPFIILQLIGLFVIIIWPELVTWLPAFVYK